MAVLSLVDVLCENSQQFSANVLHLLLEEVASSVSHLPSFLPSLEFVLLPSFPPPQIESLSPTPHHLLFIFLKEPDSEASLRLRVIHMLRHYSWDTSLSMQV